MTLHESTNFHFLLGTFEWKIFADEYDFWDGIKYTSCDQTHTQEAGNIIHLQWNGRGGKRKNILGSDLWFENRDVINAQDKHFHLWNDGGTGQQC